MSSECVNYMSGHIDTKYLDQAFWFHGWMTASQSPKSVTSATMESPVPLYFLNPFEPVSKFGDWTGYWINYKMADAMCSSEVPNYKIVYFLLCHWSNLVYVFNTYIQDTRTFIKRLLTKVYKALWGIGKTEEKRQEPKRKGNQLIRKWVTFKRLHERGSGSSASGHLGKFYNFEGK